MYNKLYSFRCSDETLEYIENIKKQMKVNPYFKNKNITNGYIIRLAIKTLNKGMKYYIWVDKK